MFQVRVEVLSNNTQIADHDAQMFNRLLDVLDPGSKKRLTPGVIRYIATRSFLVVARSISSEFTGKIVGMGTLIDYEKPTGPCGLIHDIAVLSELQGKGVGRKIVQTLIDHSKERHHSYVELTSRPERLSANKLYLSLGFKFRATGETNLYRLTHKR